MTKKYVFYPAAFVYGMKALQVFIASTLLKFDQPFKPGEYPIGDVSFAQDSELKPRFPFQSEAQLQSMVLKYPFSVERRNADRELNLAV